MAPSHVGARRLADLGSKADAGEIKHNDVDMIRQLHKILDDPNPFNRIKPMPELVFRGNFSGEMRMKVGKANWYDWSVDNWGRSGILMAVCPCLSVTMVSPCVQIC